MRPDFVFTEEYTSYPNYAWPGVHAIIYKLWLDDFYEIYDGEITSTLDFPEIYEIGIKFKRTESNEWIKFTLLSSNSPISYQDIKDRVDEVNAKFPMTYSFVNPYTNETQEVESVDLYSNGVINRQGEIVDFEVPKYLWYGYPNTKNHAKWPDIDASWSEDDIIYILDMDECLNKINPVFIIIDNLKANTEYDLKGYYKTSINGLEEDFNVMSDSETDYNNSSLKTFPDYFDTNIIPDVRYTETNLDGVKDWSLSSTIITVQTTGSSEEIDAQTEVNMQVFFWNKLAKPAMKIINDMGVWKRNTNFLVLDRLTFRVMEDVSFGLDFNINLYAYKDVHPGDNVDVIGASPDLWLDRTVRALGKYLVEIANGARYTPAESTSYTENGTNHIIYLRNPFYVEDRGDREAICKTMEFFTHSPKSVWSGDSGEFPFLNTEGITLGRLYRLVAGMFVNRHWWSNVNTPLADSTFSDPNNGYGFYERSNRQEVGPGDPNYDPLRDWYVN